MCQLYYNRTSMPKQQGRLIFRRWLALSVRYVLAVHCSDWVGSCNVSDCLESISTFGGCYSSPGGLCHGNSAGVLQGWARRERVLCMQTTINTTSATRHRRSDGRGGAPFILNTVRGTVRGAMDEFRDKDHGYFNPEIRLHPNYGCKERS
ncbi:uncharacterized protein BDV14DRAFT_49260 [Aspergillus stella-maris]|uniref:uncharacterized protein n=1 Tax=Aspergillus stella-maris TaxID=1810926 RepID=UPI003CCCC062